MSRNTLLAKLSPLYRNLTDLALKISANLVAYDDITVYRYSIKETEYRDRTKTLLETVTNVNMYLDFPGEVPTLNTYVQSLEPTSVTFIEDLLPVMAIFPWRHRGRDLKVDIEDEFEVPFFNENNKESSIRFTIKELRSERYQSYFFREYVVSPTRTDTTDTRLDDSGELRDENFEQENIDVYSQYD